MVPQLASVLTLSFVAYLFFTDIRKRPGRSMSWLPLVWMFIAGSRWISSWLDMSPPFGSVDVLSECSPIDRAAFSVLILWGVIILSRRQINWGRLLTQNKWIVLYLLYCLSSILWADESFILAKRWLKDLGTPIVALVMLTEERPFEAVGITLRRLAFLLLPLSVLYIKFYPALGRAYHNDGSPMYTGVGHQKNDLGLMCLTAGMYFAWKIFQKRGEHELAEKSDINDWILMGMLVWLLLKSDSQTSTGCLLMAMTAMLIARVKPISNKPSRLIAVSALGAISYAILESTMHIKEFILDLMGRDPSLTSRTEIWDVVFRHEGNPIIGVGFMSFWSGERLLSLWDECKCRINQAHNGYVEQYVNLGYVGVAFIVIIMLSGLLKVRKELDTDPAAGVLRFCFITVAALYNYTEASFYGISNMWLMMMIGCIDISGVAVPRTAAVMNPVVAPRGQAVHAPAALPVAARSRRFVPAPTVMRRRRSLN
jgi:exopolysaccharide production protein ExoQ